MSRENAEEVWAYCERMGRESVDKGPNTTNCNYALFSTPERMQAWQRGHDAALKQKRAHNDSAEDAAGD